MLHYSSSELRKVASIASLCSVMSVGFLTSLACAGSGSVAEAPDPEPSDVQAPRPEPAPAPKEPAPAAPSGGCLLYTSPSPRDGLLSRMPSSA